MWRLAGRERASKHHPPPPLAAGQDERAPQPEARRRPMSVSAGPWTRLEGRARRRFASQASTSKSALSPARHRIKFELPSGAANAGNRQRGCGERTDAPAGNGRHRLAEIGRLCRPPPAADGEADGARAFGGKLKAVGGRHGEPRDFCYDSAKAAVPQALLEADEDRLFVYRLDIDHAVGEPSLREGRGEEVLARDAP
jgi:hypothetical protein